MKIEIALVEHDGELWFESGGVKFDTLNAIDFECCKELQVVRAGETVATTWITSARGDTIFDDYGADKTNRLRGSALAAEDFSLDESLRVDVPEGFDLVTNLRSYGWFFDAFLSTVPIGETMSLSELENRLSPELERTEQVAAAAQVLRFRRREHSQGTKNP